MHLTELSKNTESKFFSCGRGCSLPGDNFVANIFLFQIQDSYISFSIILKRATEIHVPYMARKECFGFVNMSTQMG